MALSFKRRALSLVFALVLSALLSGLLLLLLSFLLYKLRFSGEYASAGVFAVYGLSCLAGGFFAGKQLKTRRFIWGGLCGLLYFALLLALSLLTGELHAGAAGIAAAALTCAASGALGGMIS